MGRGMEQATQHQFNNPMWAAAMDPQGMHYAAPSMMTNANTGAFRRDPVGDRRTTAPYSVTGETPPPSMMPLPLPFGATSPLGVDTLTRTRPELNFARSFDGQVDRGSEHARLIQGGFEDYSQGAGKAIAGMHGSAVGGVVGAGAGAFVGGPKGAVAGAEIGSLVGAFAGYIPGVDKAASSMFRPAIERRADAIQTQFGSRQFLTGGQDLDMTGAGLSTDASQGLMEDFDEIASSQGLTRADVTQLMQMSGEQGLLDMASNADQIADTMKNMTSLLGTMAEITGDPDFMNNIQKIARLRRLGFDPKNASQSLKNMDSYARMAGMDMDQVMEREGMQGSATYNAAGLLAAQGMEAGFMGTGQSHMLTQSGALSEQELALYGGQSGVGQHIMEANAAFMSGPMSESLMPFFLQKGEDGLQVDSSSIDRVISGDADVRDIMREGSSKFHNDLDSVAEMQDNRQRLMMDIGEETGQEGMQAMMLMMAKDLADQTPGMSLRGSLQTMGLSEEQSSVLHEMANSPEYWNNLEQQQDQEIQRLQHEEQQRMENYEPHDTSRWGRFKRGVGNAGFGIQGGISNQLARHEEEQRRLASGIMYSEGTGRGEMTRERIDGWAASGDFVTQQLAEGGYLDEDGSSRVGEMGGFIGGRIASGGTGQQRIRTAHGETGALGLRNVGSRLSRLGRQGTALASLAVGDGSYMEEFAEEEVRRDRTAQDTSTLYQRFGRMSDEERLGSVGALQDRIGDDDLALDAIGSVRSAMSDEIGWSTTVNTGAFNVEDMRTALRDSGMDDEQIESAMADGGAEQILAAAQQGMSDKEAHVIDRDWHAEMTEDARADELNTFEDATRQTSQGVANYLREAGHKGTGRWIIDPDKHLDEVGDVKDETWEFLGGVENAAGGAGDASELDEKRAKAYLAQVSIQGGSLSEEEEAEMARAWDEYVGEDAEGAADIRDSVRGLSPEALDEMAGGKAWDMFVSEDGEFDAEGFVMQAGLGNWNAASETTSGAVAHMRSEGIDIEEGLQTPEELAEAINNLQGEDFERAKEMGLTSAAENLGDDEESRGAFMEQLRGLPGVGEGGLELGLQASSEEIAAYEQQKGITATLKETFSETWANTEENTKRSADNLERLVDMQDIQLTGRQRDLLERD